MNLVNQQMISDIKSLISVTKENAIRKVDFERTLMYWHIGKRIFEEEQQGKDRAEYGTYIIKYLSEQLLPEYGSGFGVRQLELMRQFYRMFPIANTLYSQLSWTQYKLLLIIEDGYKIEFYVAESTKSN